MLRMKSGQVGQSLPHKAGYEHPVLLCHGKKNGLETI